MSNELNNILSLITNGTYEGITIGGGRCPGSTFISPGLTGPLLLQSTSTHPPIFRPQSSGPPGDSLHLPPPAATLTASRSSPGPPHASRARSPGPGHIMMHNDLRQIIPMRHHDQSMICQWCWTRVVTSLRIHPQPFSFMVGRGRPSYPSSLSMLTIVYSGCVLWWVSVIALRRHRLACCGGSPS